ncbi:MAG: HAD family hydrolase [Ruminococcus sp.]|nr:HAD family hydrolase [Ruminococcus sp.]
MDTESIIFDLDGTLWDSSENVAASWTRTVKNSGDPRLAGSVFTAGDLQSVMGMTMPDIAAKLFPMLNEREQLGIMQKCSDEEAEYLAVNGGRLFDGTEDVLTELAGRHRLFIVSNCQCGYIEAFLKYSGLGRLFDGHLCWGETLAPKSETITALMKNCSVSSAVYVGDTQGDCDSAYGAGIPFVHAAYGFGRISSPEKVYKTAGSISQLTEIF